MSSIQTVFIALAILHWACQLTLRKANERRILSLRKKIPTEVDPIMDEKTWLKASDYSMAKSKSSNFEDFFSLLIFIPVFLFAFPFFFANLDTSLQVSPWRCSLFVTFFMLALQLPTIPFDWYRQFRLEEKFGFNKSTLKLWIGDKAKGFVLGFLLVYLLLALLLFSFREISAFLPQAWWCVSFAVFFLIQILLMVLWPKFVLPLFNKITPLEEGELKQRLMSLAERTGFKAKSIEVMDGSKRSGHSNAFFTGFGKFRRIVLYDTLLNQLKDEEVEAVLAHEVGHYVKGHVPKRLLLSFLSGLVFFWLVSISLESAWLYEALNLPDLLVGSASAIIVFFSLVAGYVTYWISPLGNYLSRKHEFEADSFARDAMGNALPLIHALRSLYKENLSHPLPHPWIATFHFSHPTIIERERALST